MSWDAKAGLLRCGASWYTGTVTRHCANTVQADTPVAARALARANGWHRGRGPGTWADRCPAHHP